MKLLSYAGKIVLIKHVLQALRTYTLTTLTPPKGILELLEKHFANFLWSSNDGHNKYH